MKNCKIQTCLGTDVWKIIKLLFLGMVVVSLLTACGSSEDDEDTADSETGEWAMSMRYRYFYYPDGDVNEDLLEREEDDNNADGIIDEYWVYYYEDDPVNTGERRKSQYELYSGEYGEGDLTAQGYYTYSSAGYLIELEQDPISESADSYRWEYTYNDEGDRTGYTYYVDDVESETGAYQYDANGNVVELETSNGTWYYELNSNGDRTSYDYYEDGELVREGTYTYDDEGVLIRLDSYEQT